MVYSADKGKWIQRDGSDEDVSESICAVIIQRSSMRSHVCSLNLASHFMTFLLSYSCTSYFESLVFTRIGDAIRVTASGFFFFRLKRCLLPHLLLPSRKSLLGLQNVA